MFRTEILRLKFIKQGHIFVKWVDRSGFEGWFYTFNLRTGLYHFWSKFGDEVEDITGGLTKQRATFILNILMHEEVKS